MPEGCGEGDGDIGMGEPKGNGRSDRTSGRANGFRRSGFAARLPAPRPLPPVNTLMLPTDTPAALAEGVRRAVAALGAGEPVGLPTETVYGLAADARNPAAVARIFETKERPFFDPLIVHVLDVAWLEEITAARSTTAATARTLTLLTKHFWPGPLTLLLPKRPENVPDLVTAGSALVAVRCPAHPVFRAVLGAFGRPLAAPSANRFGRISPTDGAHVLAELDGRIPLVLDAGSAVHGLESTIVAPQPDGTLRILRPGPVTAETLGEIAPVIRTGGTPESAAAPGQLPSHYAPRTPLRLLPTAWPAGARAGLLAWRRDRPPALTAARTEFLSAAGDLREAAANLFAGLRRLDAAGLDLLVAETVPETGLGVAINERLRRAAAR